MEPLVVKPLESTSRFYVIYNLEKGVFVGHLGALFPNAEFAKRFHLLEDAKSHVIRSYTFNHRIFAVKAVYEFTEVK